MGYLSNTLFIRAKPLPASRRQLVWLPPVYLQGARLKNAGNGDLGLVGEIRTRIIVVAVRHITFLSPRDSSHASAAPGRFEPSIPNRES